MCAWILFIRIFDVIVVALVASLRSLSISFILYKYPSILADCVCVCCLNGFSHRIDIIVLRFVSFRYLYSLSIFRDVNIACCFIVCAHKMCIIINSWVCHLHLVSGFHDAFSPYKHTPIYIRYVKAIGSSNGVTTIAMHTHRQPVQCYSVHLIYSLCLKLISKWQ